MRTGIGGWRAMRSANAIDAVNAWPSSTTFSTRPQSSASAAPIRSDARITACLVRAGPISASMRGIEPQLMFMPSSTSGMRKCAERPQVRKSSDTTSAAPPPTQWPSIAAMVIWSMSCQALHIFGPMRCFWMRSPTGRVARAHPSGSFRSKPAEKAFAEPVRITTVVSMSSSKSRGTSRSSRIACWLSALMLSPRSKRTTAMRPCGPRPFSTFTNRRSIARSSVIFSKLPARLYKREPLRLTGLHVESH